MKVASFDIFDTCLLRLCGTDLEKIDILSRSAFSESVSDVEYHNFVRSRLNADYNLDSANKTLVDIYRNIHYFHPSLLPLEEIMQHEIELERIMLSPVHYMRKRVAEFRKKGYKIIFISDMYLPSVFLKEMLFIHGYLKEEDSLYVSCECGCTKYDGELYAYIANKEQAQYRNWIHFGDNQHSDFKIPQSLGIHASIIKNNYLPYQNVWRENEVSLQYPLGKFVASLSRGVYYQSAENKHKGIVLDVIAPLYVPFVCRIFNDACKRGIKKMFFCARDANSLYKIAKRIVPLFPNIEIGYLYVSQQSLYYGNRDAMLGYFRQEGLATYERDVAIVDVRSTGKSLKFLNDILKGFGYREVFGYFFEMFCNGKAMDDMPPYYCEVDHVYSKIHGGNIFRGIEQHWCLFEMYFSIHNEQRTIDYIFSQNSFQPIFAQKEDGIECKFSNLSQVAAIHNEVIKSFTEGFIKMGLVPRADEIFQQIALPTLISFFENPKPHYLTALTEFYVRDEQSLKLQPYVEKHGLLYMSIIRKKMLWWKASRNYSLYQLLGREI